MQSIKLVILSFFLLLDKKKYITVYESVYQYGCMKHFFLSNRSVSLHYQGATQTHTSIQYVHMLKEPCMP